MASPFRRYQMTVRARLAAIAEGGYETGAAPMPTEGPDTREYFQLLARLHNDLRTLHTIQSNEAKAEAKKDFIEAYRPWLEGALAIAPDAPAHQDEIVVTAMIWAVDIRDWELAEQLATYVIGHGLRMPERFHRGAAGYVVSEIADASLAEPESVPHDVLERMIPFSNPPHDMKDETRARLYRAIGESWMRRIDAWNPAAETAFAGGKAAMVDAALTALRRAMELDSKVGVKRPIELMERQAKKLADAAANNNQTQET